ncbi:hypothetical protein [Clostridium botulinum]|uniref:hypothetical protein n=1 Tax=Clostridium botulinum TaxID=1491 RepID=UPI0007741561|nr:hypothetical protein [Clostridium botulinum]APH20955.1 hypothetical protein NPD1_4218 [Clostridium botulinum]APQ71205.1 hypothetical protein RSJ8_4175 [Clostridium botulinum]MBN3352137.1 hypothetical protein [Clostridium botulinum]MBN3379222.1 hypothetical protein [Clostridium botulinum]
MKFISAKEFLKQPKKVQEILRKWWQPQMYDLFFRDFRSDKDTYLNGVYKSCIQDNETLKNATKNNTFLPLLVEGQLRQFIEDKTEDGLLIITPTINMQTVIQSFKKDGYIDKDYGDNLGYDFLKSLWEIVCKIAQEEVNNQKQNIISENEYSLPVIKGGGQTMREMYNEEYR